MIGDQAFSPSYDLAPPPKKKSSCLSFSAFLCVAGRAYRRKRVWRGGRERSQIIRRRESLVLYKSFILAWLEVSAGARKSLMKIWDRRSSFFLFKKDKNVHPGNLKPMEIQNLFLWNFSETRNVENNSAKTYRISRHKLSTSCTMSSILLLTSEKMLLNLSTTIVKLKAE
jgi:hypothetical protein